MKRSPALTALSHDHHKALVLSKRIEKATSAAERRALALILPEIFASELEPHFQYEERELLPRLRAAGHTELVERTLADHAQLRALSAEVGSGKLDNLATFSEALIAHVRFEEREVFETAEEALGRDYLDALLASLRMPRM